jgi:hypothetical protein
MGVGGTGGGRAAGGKGAGGCGYWLRHVPSGLQPRPAAKPSHPDPMTLAPTHTPQVWSVAGARFQGSLRGHGGWVRACAACAEGALAASGGDDRAVRVWDLRARAEVARYEDPAAGGVAALRFAPDGEADCWGGGGGGYSQGRPVIGNVCRG